MIKVKKTTLMVTALSMLVANATLYANLSSAGPLHIAKLGITDKTSNLASDSAITTNVKAHIAKDSEASVFDIHVRTTGGVVTLTGVVHDRAVKDKLIQIAKSVTDVKEVISYIDIDPTYSNKSSTMKNMIPDTAITAAIKSKFVADSVVSALDIHVDTINGIVTLSGIVSNKTAEERATAIAISTNGVVKVISNLTVKNH